MTEQEQCFIKLWETWETMQALEDKILYFSPKCPIFMSFFSKNNNLRYFFVDSGVRK
jgi:hypothetical protein